MYIITDTLTIKYVSFVLTHRWISRPKAVLIIYNPSSTEQLGHTQHPVITCSRLIHSMSSEGVFRFGKVMTFCWKKTAKQTVRHRSLTFCPGDWPCVQHHALIQFIFIPERSTDRTHRVQADIHYSATYFSGGRY